MKNIFILLTLVLLTFLSACTNHQRSSKEEALYTIQMQENFKTIIQYLCISSGEAVFSVPDRPVIFKANPRVSDKEMPEFIHIVIYETKDSDKKMAFLDDSRPPKIVFEK